MSNDTGWPTELREAILHEVALQLYAKGVDADESCLAVRGRLDIVIDTVLKVLRDQDLI